MATQLPFSLRAYRYATGALEPIAPLALRRRARRGKENPARISERLGFPSRTRPDGTLIWIHGASVGECLAVLPLMDALLAKPGRAVLMTSGTVASAEMMTERLPGGAFHQFSPVDTPQAVARFLDHWRPDAGLFVDSEIWPNILIAAANRGTRLAIINGRMSEKSFGGWLRAKRMAASLLGLFDIALVQDNETASRLKSLGARAVDVTGSLKADSPPLPADTYALDMLRRAIGTRPVFLATNTHPGEDEIILGVHDRLRRTFPTLLTIVAPRHAERGRDIAALAGPRTHALRSQAQVPDADTEIYIADTMGELGLLYRLAPFAFIGKSLGAQGGQNPLEPARLGVAVLAGPYTENFREAYDAIIARQGAGRVATADELEELALQLLNDPARARVLGHAAENAASQLGGALERTRLAVETMLQTHARP
ncbi:MAG TPA: glycosyltransferase N-terminal domain-containing protein [Rhizomicrobium sp.]|nr:glycosyltransferase N-terminal domain-containing protein [Rhizomicrobium sp.]